MLLLFKYKGFVVSARKPFLRASQANRNTKRLRDTEEWPTDAQQELQYQITSSFDISAKVFIPPLSFISTKLSILAARIKIFTYNLSISDTTSTRILSIVKC